MDKTNRNNYEIFGFRSALGRSISVSVSTVEGVSRAQSTIDGRPMAVGQGPNHEVAIEASLGVIYGKLAVNRLREIIREREANGNLLERRG